MFWGRVLGTQAAEEQFQPETKGAGLKLEQSKLTKQPGRSIKAERLGTVRKRLSLALSSLFLCPPATELGLSFKQKLKNK